MGSPSREGGACPTCGGSRWFFNGNEREGYVKCPTCDGVGRVPQEEGAPQPLADEVHTALLAIATMRGLRGCEGGGSDEPCCFPMCIASGCDGGGGGEMWSPPLEECIEDGCELEPLQSYLYCHEHLNIARAKDGLPLVDEKGREVREEGAASSGERAVPGNGAPADSKAPLPPSDSPSERCGYPCMFCRGDFGPCARPTRHPDFYDGDKDGKICACAKHLAVPAGPPREPLSLIAIVEHSLQTGAPVTNDIVRRLLAALAHARQEARAEALREAEAVRGEEMPGTGDRDTDYNNGVKDCAGAIARLQSTRGAKP